MSSINREVMRERLMNNFPFDLFVPNWSYVRRLEQEQFALLVRKQQQRDVDIIMARNITKEFLEGTGK